MCVRVLFFFFFLIGSTTFHHFLYVSYSKSDRMTPEKKWLTHQIRRKFRIHHFLSLVFSLVSISMGNSKFSSAVLVAILINFFVSSEFATLRSSHRFTCASMSPLCSRWIRTNYFYIPLTQFYPHFATIRRSLTLCAVRFGKYLNYFMKMFRRPYTWLEHTHTHTQIHREI